MAIIIVEETNTMLAVARSILTEEGYHLKEVLLGDYVPELNMVCEDTGERLDALAFIRYVRAQSSPQQTTYFVALTNQLGEPSA